MSAVDYPRRFPTPEPITASVRTRNGNIRVITASDGEAVVDLQPAQPGDSEALDVIDKAAVEMHGSTLVVEVPRGSGGPSFGPDAAIDITVTVPPGSTVQTRNGSGNVELTGPLANVSSRSGSGNVVAENCGDMSVSTGSGDIIVKDSAAVDLRSGSGDISVARCHGTVSFESASGDVRIDEATQDLAGKTASGDIEIGTLAATAQLTTASGDIRIQRATEGELTSKTASGDVTLGVPTGTAAKLDCSSLTGRMASALHEGDAPSGGEKAVIVSIRSVSGSISIERAG